MHKARSYLELVKRYRQAARRAGASMAVIGDFRAPSGVFEIYQIALECGEGRQSICISTGIHGNEPAGPEALLRGIAELGRMRDSLDARFTIYPCDNPTGHELDTRENWAGLDLNREFAKEGQADEIAIVERSLAGKSFDLTFDLHEDYEMHGFYLYERAPEGRAAEAQAPAGDTMIAALRDRGYPINDADVIDGRPASGGIIRPSGKSVPGLRDGGLPKALFLWRQGCRHLITTESPGLAPLGQRVEMQMVCFNIMLDWIRQKRFLPENAAAGTERIQSNTR